MTARRHVIALSAIALLVACGTTTTGDARRTGQTTLGTDIKTLDPSGSEIVVTEDPNGNKQLTINVGTARLEGSTDSRPWRTFSSYQFGCRWFSWGDDTSVPITLVDIAFSNATIQLWPSGRPDFCQDARPTCLGFTFPVTAQRSARRECEVMVLAKEPVGSRQETIMTFTMRATCTSSDAKPCDDHRIAAAGPSSGRPVVVEWSYHEALETLDRPCESGYPPSCYQSTSAPTSNSSTPPVSTRVTTSTTSTTTPTRTTSPR